MNAELLDRFQAASPDNRDYVAQPQFDLFLAEAGRHDADLNTMPVRARNACVDRYLDDHRTMEAAWLRPIVRFAQFMEQERRTEPNDAVPASLSVFDSTITLDFYNAERRASSRGQASDRPMMLNCGHTYSEIGTEQFHNQSRPSRSGNVRCPFGREPHDPGTEIVNVPLQACLRDFRKNDLGFRIGEIPEYLVDPDAAATDQATGKIFSDPCLFIRNDGNFAVGDAINLTTLVRRMRQRHVRSLNAAPENYALKEFINDHVRQRLERKTIDAPLRPEE